MTCLILDRSSCNRAKPLSMQDLLTKPMERSIPAATMLSSSPPSSLVAIVAMRGFSGVAGRLIRRVISLLSVNLFGNGLSSIAEQCRTATARLAVSSNVTLYDNVRCQHRLLTERLEVKRVALVAGWSMAGCQPISGRRNILNGRCHRPFLCVCQDIAAQFCFPRRGEGSTAGRLNTGTMVIIIRHPSLGLKAFGRVYAGWAYSQTFFRQGLYPQARICDHRGFARWIGRWITSATGMPMISWRSLWAWQKGGH